MARSLKDGDKVIHILNGKISEFPGTLSFIRDTQPERVVLGRCE